MRNSPCPPGPPPRRGVSMILVTMVLALVFGAVGYGVYALAGRDSQGPLIIEHVVARGAFQHDVVERGEVESSSNVEIRCEVKARNTGGMVILDVIDEGTYVEPGDLLVQLDSSAFEQDLVQQQIVCNTAEARMVQAKNTYDAAVISKKEYIEGTYMQEEQLIQSEIFIAEENLRRAQEYAVYSETLAARGYVTDQQLEGDKFAVEIAKTELDAAKTKLRVLQEYTKAKMIMQLDSDIKSAEAAWKSEQSTCQLELANLKDIESQIEKCTIVAPQAGQVVHANETGRRGDDFIVEPGVLVREQQAIIRLPDPQNMQVKAKINESRVTQVAVGMPVTIRLDAFGDATLEGEITRVNEYPEPTSWYSSQVKEYATFIAIKKPPADIKPGLTAEVTIHCQYVEDAVLVPVQAVVEHGRQTYCVAKAGDNWEARELNILGNNDKFVMLNSNVTAGDVVAMNPRRLLSLVKLPELPVNETNSIATKASSEAQTRQPPATAAQPRSGGGGGPPGGGGGADPGQIANMIFTRLDANKDGRIAATEMPAAQADRLKQSDANGDGAIDKQELIQAMRKQMSAASGARRGPPESPQ